MSSRFLTNALIALFGGWIVVASLVFASGVVGWLGFAFGIAVVALVAMAQFDRARGLPQRAVDLCLGALAGLSMGFGLGTSGSTRVWTIFAFALGWVAFSYLGLAMHEIAQWRARHGLTTLHWIAPAQPAQPLRETYERPAA